MIAQISKYSDEQILAAANCLVTAHQANRLADAAKQMLVLSAVLTLTVLAESDYDKLAAEVSQNELKETAIERALATAAQFQSAEEQQFGRLFPIQLTAPFAYEGTYGHPNLAFCQESAIGESALLSQLQLLYGIPRTPNQIHKQ